MGADDGRSIGMTGSDIAPPIWATVMQTAVRRTPPRQFTPPPGIVMASVESGTGRRACGSDAAINEAFRLGSEPPPCEVFANTPVVKDIVDWFRGHLSVGGRRAGGRRTLLRPRWRPPIRGSGAACCAAS